jgi:hypothetical protein
MRTPVLKTHLIGFIWLATAIDIWCCQWLTTGNELNPLAQWILAEHGVWTLISCKVFGTWIATEWLRYLHFAYSVGAAMGMLGVLLILGGVIPV